MQRLGRRSNSRRQRSAKGGNRDSHSSSPQEGVVKYCHGRYWFRHLDKPLDKASRFEFSKKDADQLGDGDSVRVQFKSSGFRWKKVQLIKVLQRKRELFPALVLPNHWLEPLGRGMPRKCWYRSGNDTVSSSSGDVVVARWSPAEENASRNKNGYVLVERLLGPPEQPGVAAKQALASFDIPHEWPVGVERACKELPKAIPLGDSRRDLRKQAFCTLDGAKAKDFDDAVWCEILPAGGWRLQVAIADVSAYVPAGSALDREAEKRGTSVYFSDRVIPMLPEALSEDMCSLKPGEDRPVVVCDMHIAADGSIGSWEIYRALICSRVRFVYSEVEKALQVPDCRHRAACGLEKELLALRQAADALQAAAKERGALEIDMPEAQLTAQADNPEVGVQQVQRLRSEALIESAMLAANRCVALELKKRGTPAPMKVCKPLQEKWMQMRQMMRDMGVADPGNQPDHKAYAELLKNIADRPDALFLKGQVIRTLKAFYSPDTSIGHFPLALDAYTYFTSPIRRYPDLLVHRQLFAEGGNGLNLEDLCEHCSCTAKRAEWAGVQEKKHRQCIDAKEQEGTRRKGRVSDIFPGGLRIYLHDFKMEGFLPKKEVLGKGAFIDPERELVYIPHLFKEPFGIGTEIEVNVKEVRPEKQEIILSEPKPV